MSSPSEPADSFASFAMLGNSTIYLTMSWVDINGNPTDPDSGTQTLTIKDSHDNTIQSYTSGQLTRVSQGNYQYAYVTPVLSANDIYCAQWYASIGGYPDTRRFYFPILA